MVERLCRESTRSPVYMTTLHESSRVESSEAKGSVYLCSILVTFDFIRPGSIRLRRTQHRKHACNSYNKTNEKH